MTEEIKDIPEIEADAVVDEPIEETPIEEAVEGEVEASEGCETCGQ